MPNLDEKYHVFISHSSKDAKWANAVCKTLERRAVRCWIAPRDIVPGTEWGEAIIDGIDRSRMFVLIFSASANESAQVRREVERAIGKSIPIIPMRIEDIQPKGAMEYALSNTHWLDAFVPPATERLAQLADSVEALLGVSKSPEEIRRGQSLKALGRKVRKTIFVAMALCLMAVVAYMAFPKVIGALSSIGQSGRSVANGNVSTRVAFTNSIGMKFSRIESGKFTMGTDSGRRAGTAPPQNEIAHEVELSRPFFMATCEVTQRQWNTVMPEKADNWKDERNVIEGDDVAACFISWQDAQAFIAKLNELERNTGRRYRLPTEAEWEYACRAGARTKFSFGNDESEMKSSGWCSLAGSAKGSPHAHRVGQHQPNGWGLYDMHGNVLEWCEDVYSKDFYESPEAKKDPLCQSSATVQPDRVLRGGSWRDTPANCRASIRYHKDPAARDAYIGFRVVAELK